MSLNAFLLWVLSLLGISNGPCPTGGSAAQRLQGNGFCGPERELQYERSAAEMSDKQTNEPPAIVTDPADDISNGF